MLAFLTAAALAVAPAPCAADTPPALQLNGVPPIAIPGKAYRATLEGEGKVVDTAGSDIAVKDRSGRGWSAHYEYARDVAQAFSVGLDGAPFTVTATYVEPVGDSGQCTRTLTVQLPIERHILAVVNCRRGLEEPKSGLVLRCDGSKLRVKNLAWHGWNGATTTGRGAVDGKAVTVTLSKPRECSELNGFIYTRATLTTASRVLTRIPIDCPLPPRS
jgi:hypothetical protein